MPQGTSAETGEIRKKRIQFFLAAPGPQTLDTGPALRQAKFQARPPDGARLARAELAVGTRGRQMAVEAAAPRAVPGHGETGRARGSQCGPGCPSTSGLAAAAAAAWAAMTQPVPRISVPAALALGTAALGAAFATGLFLGE